MLIGGRRATAQAVETSACALTSRSQLLAVRAVRRVVRTLLSFLWTQTADGHKAQQDSVSDRRPDRRPPHPCAFVARRPSIALRCTRGRVVVSSRLPSCLCRHAPDEHDSMAGVACRRAEIALLETLRQRQRRASTPATDRGRHESAPIVRAIRIDARIKLVAWLRCSALQCTAVHGPLRFPRGGRRTRALRAARPLRLLVRLAVSASPLSLPPSPLFLACVRTIFAAGCVVGAGGAAGLRDGKGKQGKRKEKAGCEGKRATTTLALPLTSYHCFHVHPLFAPS